MRKVVGLYFVAVVGFGLWINERSWNGQVFVYMGSERSPAAVRALGDYTSIDHASLYRSVQAQLLNHAEVYTNDGRYGVELGLPLVSRHSGGGKDFACNAASRSGLFDRMEMTFVGVGVSEGGESPKMIVDSPCRSKNDLNKLETVWIPMQDLKFGAQSRDRVFDLGAGDQMHVHLSTVPSAWPTQWVLWTVKLYNRESPDDALTINTDLLKSARSKLLSLGE